MIKITVQGGFHNAPVKSFRVRTIDNKVIISSGQFKRITGHMCGIPGCLCGIRHGWIVNGTSVDDLAEALLTAQIEIELNRSN